MLSVLFSVAVGGGAYHYRSGSAAVDHQNAPGVASTPTPTKSNLKAAVDAHQNVAAFANHAAAPVAKAAPAAVAAVAEVPAEVAAEVPAEVAAE